MFDRKYPMRQLANFLVFTAITPIIAITPFLLITPHATHHLFTSARIILYAALVLLCIANWLVFHDLKTTVHQTYGYILNLLAIMMPPIQFAIHENYPTISEATLFNEYQIMAGDFITALLSAEIFRRYLVYIEENANVLAQEVDE